MSVLLNYFGLTTSTMATEKVSNPQSLENNWKQLGDVKSRTYYARIYDNANLRDVSITCSGVDSNLNPMQDYPSIMKVGGVFFVTIKNLEPGFDMSVTSYGNSFKKNVLFENVFIDRGHFLAIEISNNYFTGSLEVVNHGQVSFSLKDVAHDFVEL